MCDIFKEKGITASAISEINFSGGNAINNLQALVNSRGSGLNITSCAVTASIVFDLLCAVGPINPSAKKNVESIEKLLNFPNVVGISVSPDHHFVIFPTSLQHVSILQSFEDAYTIVDWCNRSNYGRMDKREFINAMKSLLSNSNDLKIEAALKLFSYGEVDKNIISWFQDRPVRITSIGTKPLV